MEVTTLDVANLLDGQLDDVPNQSLSGFAGIEDAAKGDLTFLANLAYEGHLYTTGASAVLVSKEFVPSAPMQPGTCLIRVEDPYAAMAKLMQAYGTSAGEQTGTDTSPFLSRGRRLCRNWRWRHHRGPLLCRRPQQSRQRDQNDDR